MTKPIGRDFRLSIDDGTGNFVPIEPAQLKIGDRVAMPPRKLDIRPAWTGSGKTSFKPARNGKRQ